MKFFIETYGCQMNISDSELVTSILKERGYQKAKSIEEADIIIFNTCSVRQHAEQRVIGRINNEMSRKRNNPNIKIGVIGCMAQRLGAELHKQNKKIDFVVGVDQYQKLPELIEETFVKPDFKLNTILNSKEIYKDIYPEREGQLNAFVTIMRGCNNFCTYCIVPYTRGRERSRPMEDILKEVEEAGKKGFKDITLLGQNVNSYNYNGVNFAQLLREVNKIDTIKRIRFVTSHPKDLSDEVIEVMAKGDKICEHLHLALQSGDNDILKRMNRGYTAEHFLEIVKKLRNSIPNIAITTDIIAGFPGETEEQFMKTYRIMEKIRFDYAFTYKYSPRQGTKAAEYTDQIDEKIRLERLQRLIKLQEKITLEKYRENIGRIKEVYVEKISKKNKDEVAGKTRDFKITVFKGTPDLIGKFVKVKITDATGWTLKGEMVDVS
jgi:tRNA-2-methylthio-N6-dimethylallyladenosine synthase